MQKSSDIALNNDYAIQEKQIARALDSHLRSDKENIDPDYESSD
jgi:hypothetical protein